MVLRSAWIIAVLAGCAAAGCHMVPGSPPPAMSVPPDAGIKARAELRARLEQRARDVARAQGLDLTGHHVWTIDPADASDEWFVVFEPDELGDEPVEPIVVLLHEDGSGELLYARRSGNEHEATP